MKNNLLRPSRSVSQPKKIAPSTAPARYALPAKPTSALLKRSTGLALSAPATVPASVTSSPSRIQVMPSATTTSVWKRPQGSRSSRAGISVSTIGPVAVLELCWVLVSMVHAATFERGKLFGLDAQPRRTSILHRRSDHAAGLSSLAAEQEYRLFAAQIPEPPRRIEPQRRARAVERDAQPKLQLQRAFVCCPDAASKKIRRPSYRTIPKRLPWPNPR